MKVLSTASFLLAATFGLTASNAMAADFGVALEWNTNDIHEVMDTMAEQRAAFGELIDNGEIKDMYTLDSHIDGKPVKILKFVIEADNKEQVTAKLSDLPMYKKELVKIANIRPLGSKWLDNTPVNNNYGVTFTWQQNVGNIEMDRVLGIDLQRVISLNQAGLVTSSYLNTQQLDNGQVRPIYLLSMLAKDAQQARELSKQFEAVNLDYATVEVEYLGHKLNFNSKAN
ncbi:hypothetical protein MD588_19380 [Photobacterium sp. SDRW27]|uniref:hypothetical protein n=1 Tax=Photobacterium obscurum TaxID=2829490 RepID=UPI002243464A|nr:hypothetical protein [Photobacterium obscurum]MCW8330960.1 hypothetical protein [Photobacterium obscurum]